MRCLVGIAEQQKIGEQGSSVYNPTLHIFSLGPRLSLQKWGKKCCSEYQTLCRFLGSVWELD